MPELRKDPIIGRWVIIATERAKRPSDFKKEEEETNDSLNCPFCEGKEKLTPPEILSYRKAGTLPNSAGWWLRVVPNKYPALQIGGELNKRGIGIYDIMNGIGAHEVIIETPEHHKRLSELDLFYIEEMFWAYRDRIIDLRRDPRFLYILIFRNRGKSAGASLSHPHSQLIALPIVPKRVNEEMNGAKTYYNYHERCIYCDMVKQEINSGERLIAENDFFVAFNPFAARFPFESWIIPKKHDSAFEDILKYECGQLSKILKEVLQKIDVVLGNPPYNYILHNSPLNTKDLPYYHWHIEIMPKLTQVAGFEWGSGFYINPMLPEDCSKYLREVQI